MKFLSASILVVFVMLTTAFTAHAQDGAARPLQQGSYAMLEGGVNFHAATDSYYALTGTNRRLHLKTGYAISGGGGYKWSNGLRVEGEFSYHRNKFKYINTPANPYSGRQVTASFMVNAIYDINTGSRITPYIGGGVGGTMAWFKQLSQLTSGVTSFQNDDSSRFAYQGIAGVAIAIAPQWETLVDFRYRVSDGHKFSVLNVVGTFNSYSRYNIHETTVMAGLRYAF
jgi:opacity protein-like surface antigen